MNASCCKGVSARWPLWKCSSESRCCKSLFSTIHRRSWVTALRAVERGKYCNAKSVR